MTELTQPSTIYALFLGPGFPLSNISCRLCAFLAISCLTHRITPGATQHHPALGHLAQVESRFELSSSHPRRPNLSWSLAHHRVCGWWWLFKDSLSTKWIIHCFSLGEKENKLNHLCLTVFIPTGRIGRALGGRGVCRGRGHPWDRPWIQNIISREVRQKRNHSFLCWDKSKKTAYRTYRSFLGNGNEVSL